MASPYQSLTWRNIGPHRGGRTYAMEEAYPVLKRDYPLNEKNLDWWASDRDSPYTEVKRFDWFRGYQVGGRSLIWGRHSYRLSDLDFDREFRGDAAAGVTAHATRISRRGTRTSSAMPALRARSSACRSTRTASSCRRSR